MNEQNVTEISTGTEKTFAATDQLKRTTTKNGKIRARWTMKVSFTDGNVFTYRSDTQKEYFISKGYSNNGREISEIEAIVLKFTKVRGRIETAQLFDNSLPKGEETIFDYAAGIIMLNRLPRMGSGRSFSFG